MCEIAMLKADRYPPAMFVGICKKIYTRMSHGLGVVSIVEGDGKFEYEIYRDADPDWSDLLDWFAANESNATWFAIHGRLATSGERGQEGVHPLDIECEQCNTDFVLHNGIYATQAVEWEIMAMEDEGHSVQTSIDTELMAHKVGGVPGTIDEAEELMDGLPGAKRQGGFIMFNEDNIFIWSNRYVLNEEMEMYHSHRDFANPRTDDNYDYAVITAPEAEAEVTA